ncbi:MAG: Benzylsuccinate synthase activating enzyme [Chloroflexi bacterium ADurb.Bin360]|nr:MAG: Benzylsuccinate synthase activating enzyme [Chloroflexi bacterium ADurb.Bin360]
MTSDTARILHLQRLSTEDGPGIRTTVFFKGCPLACAWCHNPESIPSQPQVQWLEQRCIGCGTCLEACPRGCLSRDTAGAIVIDRSCCAGCGTCATACPANALELLGRTLTVDELVREVLKDRAYFEASGGGVTLSGGEPTLQATFAKTFLQRMRAEGVQTALDTCGLMSPATLETLLPYVDLVLYDLKEIDAEKHRTFTGQSNTTILENARLLRRLIAESAPATRLWIRTPLIPGATATRENLLGLGAFITSTLDGVVERWELCAFNNLCRDKYRRLGLTWAFAATPLMTAEELAEMERWARESGVAPAMVLATGAARS